VTVVTAVLIGVLTATGTALVLHRTLTRIILGIGLLGNAVNLLILTSGSRAGDAPIVGAGDNPTDPVPQALILTAIVIGLGTVSFLLAVAYRSWTIDGNDVVEDDIEDRRVARAVAADRDRDLEAEAAREAEPDAGSFTESDGEAP
jgi:multicomponent Na+:H+ antiporter subunit C